MYTRTLAARPFSSIPKANIDWLWHPFIPRGRITLLAGDPGSGKTSLALQIAASLSRGLPLPNPHPHLHPHLHPHPNSPQMNNDQSSMNNPLASLLLSADDNPSDFLRPKLEAMNANLDHIHLLPSLFSLLPQKPLRTKDSALGTHCSPIDRLDDFLPSIPNLALLIIDPITHILGLTDRLLPQHPDAPASPRSILHALANLAEKHNIALLLISRLNKQFDPANPTPNLQRIFGRTDFPTTARSVLLLSQLPNPNLNHHLNPHPPESTGTPPAHAAPQPVDHTAPPIENQNSKIKNHPPHLLLPLKSNLTSPPAPLPLTISETVTFHPNTPIPQRPQKKSGPEPLILQSAITWLHAALADGPQTACEIRESARNNAISPATLNRARALASIEVIKQDWSGRWFWRLPNDPRPLPTDPLEKQMFEVLNRVRESNSRLALASDHPEDLPDDLVEDPPESRPSPRT